MAAAGTVRAQDLSNAVILRNFDVIAFRNEMRKIENPRVTKWVQPIRAYKRFDVTVEPQVEDFLDKHMDRLRRATGLDIEYVNSPRQSNFLIIFTRREAYLRTALRYMNLRQPGTPRNMRQRLQRTHCLGVYRAKQENSELVRAIVVIPVDHARARGILTRCIVEETTQSMGLPNDSNDANPSVFNDTSRLVDLSWHDILLLRLLYHPELEVGTPRAEALPIARRILPRLRRQ